MYLYVGYINEATNFAESQGGGGSDTKDWGREKDEDEIEWIRRCLRQATKMVKPRKGKGLSRQNKGGANSLTPSPKYFTSHNNPCDSLFSSDLNSETSVKYVLFNQ